MKETIIIRELGNGIRVLNEPIEGLDVYLITGKHRALVVDAFRNTVSLYEKIREITDLPLDVVLTHGHGDHAGLALKDFHEAGCEIYMSENDLPLLTPELDKSWFKPLSGDMRFELGGFELDVLPLPGHTSGSVLLFDKVNQILYTGDAIGAGVFWMQIPSALPLSEFLGNLEMLWSDLKGYKELKIHPGHRHQSPVQLTLEFLEDTLLMTRKIVSGEWVGEDEEMDYHGLYIKYKNLSYKLMTDYCYHPDNI